MKTDSIHETLLRALGTYRSDDLERATRAFAGLSRDEMNEEYGQSGQTRQQILDGYHEHASSVERAIAWVNANAPRG